MHVVSWADAEVRGGWGGLAIMVTWVAAALLGGFVLLKSRDA
jgi:ABC-2 type transport system permease protein